MTGVRGGTVAAAVLMLLVTLATAHAVEPPLSRVVGTLTLLARTDVGVGRRIGIKVARSRSEQGTKLKVMEFFLDDRARLTDHGGRVTFTELTIGLPVRVDYVQDRDGRLRAVVIHIQHQDEEDAPGEAVSL